MNETIKKELLEYASKIEIEPTLLDTCKFVRNPFGVEDQLIGKSSVYECDDEDLFRAQIEVLITYIKADGVGEYCKLSDDEHEKDNQDKELSHQAINWLNSLLGE